MTKLCTERKHYRRRWIDPPNCGHPDWVSLVDGKPLHWCQLMRDIGDMCGAQGKLWEAKEPTTPMARIAGGYQPRLRPRNTSRRPRPPPPPPLVP